MVQAAGDLHMLAPHRARLLALICANEYSTSRRMCRPLKRLSDRHRASVIYLHLLPLPRLLTPSSLPKRLALPVACWLPLSAQAAAAAKLLADHISSILPVHDQPPPSLERHCHPSTPV